MARFKSQGHVHPRRNEDGELNWDKDGVLTRPVPFVNEQRLEVQRRWMKEQSKATTARPARSPKS